MNLRAKLRRLFDDLGLLPAVETAYLEIAELKQMPNGLKFYLYNYWLTNFPSNSVRLLYLRRALGIEIGKQTFVHMGCYFEGDKIIIGDNTVIGRQCFLGGNGGALTIKNNVSITARTYIFCASHQVDSPNFAGVHDDVVIEDYAWIGAGATIQPGVHVGRGAVLGAVAVATKDIPEFAIWAGVPARPIGIRSRELSYKLRYAPYFV